MTRSSANRLIRILQNAHSGELAAAFAYRGHWRSLKVDSEREAVRKIESEEWAHRAKVGDWLDYLGARPKRRREFVFRAIGRILGVSCFVAGRFLPMYFAGRLESQNVLEYAEAAEMAAELGLTDCESDMMRMARVEAEHEAFFRGKVAEHRLLPAMTRVFGWN